MQTSSDKEHWMKAANPPRRPRAVSPDGTAIDCGWNGITYATDQKSWKKASVPIDQTGICAVVSGVRAFAS